jgi:hypothetical protein
LTDYIKLHHFCNPPPPPKKKKKKKKKEEKEKEKKVAEDARNFVQIDDNI